MAGKITEETFAKGCLPKTKAQITTTVEARMALRDADMMDWELFTDERTESDAHPDHGFSLFFLTLTFSNQEKEPVP